MMNLNEAKEILKYTISNNNRLENEGKKKTTISFTGEAGIGKTEMVRQVAEELGMTFIKLNLAQLEEVGDLAGYPLKEYYMCNPEGNKCDWIGTDVLEYYISAGWQMEGNMHRMGYAVPSWVPREENPNGILLFLDDYNRATPMFMQATMELIDRFEYVSFKLPKGTSIILSCNPDDGSYSLGGSLDAAQSSRFIDFEVEFDVKTWAKWAEENEIRGELINFVLAHGEEIFTTKDQVQVANARSYVTFANTISGIDDFTTKENLAFILKVAKGCFADKHNIVGSLFTTFINTGMCNLISPEEMINSTWNTLKPKFEKCVYKNNNYQSHISSILATRFVNYVEKVLTNKSVKKDKIAERFVEILKNDKPLLSEDLVLHFAQKINKTHPDFISYLLQKDTDNILIQKMS